MAVSTRQVFSDVLLVVAVLLVLALGYGACARLVTPPGSASTAAAERVREGEVVGDVQVEILNGTMEDGLAARTRAHLRAFGGIDVVDTRNAPDRTQDTTVVIDRVGNLPAARRVAQALGLPPSRVRSDPRSDLFVDATVLLGADYPTLAPFQPSGR